VVVKIVNSVWKLVIFLLLILFNQSVAAAAVEVEPFKTLQMSEVPIDLALTSDGKQLFVLTEEGNILIYESGGTPTDKIAVGRDFDQIKIAPGGQVLILGSQKTQSVQLMTISVIQEINVAGSPFKGPEDAPVVIAIFDDFQ
jgi:ligand-binding sensor domain-containing protein